ncbi:MAG TPA: hypothetical protein VIM65_15350 [Cyclobacteriaceae bacterium]
MKTTLLTLMLLTGSAYAQDSTSIVQVVAELHATGSKKEAVKYFMETYNLSKPNKYMIEDSECAEFIEPEGNYYICEDVIYYNFFGDEMYDLIYKELASMFMIIKFTPEDGTTYFGDYIQLTKAEDQHHYMVFLF